MFLIIFALALGIWCLIFISRIATSGYPRIYISYLLGFIGFVLMAVTDEAKDPVYIYLFLIFGFFATIMLFGLALSLLGEGIWREQIFAALEMRDSELQLRHKIILWLGAVVFIGLPWSIVLGLFE